MASVLSFRLYSIVPGYDVAVLLVVAAVVPEDMFDSSVVAM